MSIDAYNKARRQGEKSYKDALARGEYPYIQVLEEIISHTEIITEVDLGLVEIPIEHIHGTYTAGRRTAFAPDFMPLLSNTTEFAAKWESLYTSLEEEGLNEPIRAYEYLHRYYVMEGNKRVSVMKSLGAVTIPGTVRRLIPARTDEKENRVYFEFLDFYKCCPADYLVFTRLGAYEEFTRLAGKKPGEAWTAEEQKDLRSAFMRFGNVYRKKREEAGLHVRTGDAFLIYCNIMGYQESVNKMPSEMDAELDRIFDEIRLFENENTVELVMEPAEAPKKPLLQRLFTDNNRTMNLAFIYDHDPEDSSWTYGHELGRLAVQDYYGDAVTTKAYVTAEPENEKAVDEVLEQAVKDGADVIFVTTRRFLNSALRTAVLHPEAKILVCTLNASHRYIRTYYTRMYEAKFLSGIVAGILSKDGKIGYLTDFPIPMNIANVNAFALGVRSVRPDAKVYLQWSSQEGADPVSYFREEGIRMISGHELAVPGSMNRDFGLYEIMDDGSHNSLAMTVYDWGILYNLLLENIREGMWDDTEKSAKNKALNYWWGMESDVIDLLLSSRVPDEVQKLVEYLKVSIKNGSYSPFYGIIHTQEGDIGIDEDYIYSPEEIMKIHWLSENVVGRIPDVEELTPTGKAILTVQGRYTDEVKEA